MKKRKLILVGLSSLSLLMLTSCDFDQLSEKLNNDIVDALIPNFWAFLVQFLALIVLIVLAGIVFYKPVRKYLDQRSEYIHNEVKSAKENNLQSKINLQESEKEIAKSKKDGSKIIDEARKAADNEKKKILDDAELEVKQMKAKALKEIEDEKARAQKEIRDQIIDVAFSASEKVLKREVNKKDDEKIIDNLIDEMGKK